MTKLFTNYDNKLAIVKISGGGGEASKEYLPIYEDLGTGVSYFAEAEFGVANVSNPVWRIKRLTVTGLNTLIEMPYDHFDLFTAIWDDRATYTYTD